jgi:hypothetical protein
MKLQLHSRNALHLPFSTQIGAMRLAFVAGYTATACLVLVSSHANGTLPPPAHHLSRRFDDETFASDEDWKAARCRGENLVDVMLSSDEEAGPKIGSTKSNNPPSAKSEWQGDLKRTLPYCPLYVAFANSDNQRS